MLSFGNEEEGGYQSVVFSAGLRVGLFTSGVIWASLKTVRNVPVVRDELIMWVRAGTTDGEITWRGWDLAGR